MVYIIIIFSNDKEHMHILDIPSSKNRLPIFKTLLTFCDEVPRRSGIEKDACLKITKLIREDFLKKLDCDNFLTATDKIYYALQHKNKQV
jgi:hypothetical protein